MGMDENKSDGLEDFLEKIMQVKDMDGMEDGKPEGKPDTKKGEGPMSAEKLLMKIAHMVQEYCEQAGCKDKGEGKPSRPMDDDDDSEDHPFVK